MPEDGGPAAVREGLRRRLNEIRQSLGLSPDQVARTRWWHQQQLTNEYRQFVAHEARASRINIYQALFIPGLLQTDDYARAITAAVLRQEPGHPHVTARVQIRLSRQHRFFQRLQGPNPPELVTFIDEAVLRRPVGGSAVLRDQLSHLMEMAQRPHITVVVVPMQIGAHPGLGGVFELLEFAGADTPDFLFVESSASDFVLKRAAATSAVRDIVRSLTAAGVQGTDAVMAIRRIRDALA
jgi:hypothetical protein